MYQQVLAAQVSNFNILSGFGTQCLNRLGVSTLHASQRSIGQPHFTIGNSSRLGWLAAAIQV
jgi:hypothetical protein